MFYRSKSSGSWEPKRCDSVNKYKGLVQMREIVILACSECKRRNYTTTKNKKTMTGKLEIKKYCKFDKKHTLHKETK